MKWKKTINKLSINDLNRVNKCIEGLNVNIRYFLSKILEMDLREGYTKGNMQIGNTICNIGVEGTNKTITKFEIFY